MSLGRAGARKVLDKHRAVIDENLRRYQHEGHTALSGDKHTTEWRLADLSDPDNDIGRGARRPPRQRR